MTDRETLLAAILNDSSDDNPRPVLADVLRESDNPTPRRGRFLCAGVAASGSATGAIAAVASAGYLTRWLSELGLGTRPLTRGD